MSPPLGAVTNRLPFIAASLRQVYTAGGFLSNFGGAMWASPHTMRDVGDAVPYKRANDPADLLTNRLGWV